MNNLNSVDGDGMGCFLLNTIFHDWNNQLKMSMCVVYRFVEEQTNQKAFNRKWLKNKNYILIDLPLQWDRKYSHKCPKYGRYFRFTSPAKRKKWQNNKHKWKILPYTMYCIYTKKTYLIWLLSKSPNLKGNAKNWKVREHGGEK